MSENKMSEMIKTSLDGIKGFTDMQNVIGNIINTPSGVTVIPVSKVSVGYATGGVDLNPKKITSGQNFGGLGGTGVTITPVAFLTINKDSKVDLIQIDEKDNSIDKLISLIEESPKIIDKIKNSLT